MTNLQAPEPTDEEEDVFRRAMGRLASGVCVITTRWGAMDHAMTATAVASVSLNPLLVMFSVHQFARFRDALESNAKWALNIMSAKGQADADWLATPGRPVIGQLDRVPFQRGSHSDAALLTNTVATLECQTYGIHEAGDHDLVVGNVLEVQLGEEAPVIVHRNAEYFQVP